MTKADNVQYLSDRDNGMELILCNNSFISYPLHNHISVFTIGLVINGSITLTLANDSGLCSTNHIFLIPPYVPHMIKANNQYTLLTLCINKETAIHCNKEKLKDKMRQLLSAVPELHLTEFQTAEFTGSIDIINGDSELHCQEPCIGIIEKQLESFPEQQLSIEQMAQTAYVSKYHFIRSFKQSVGLTPHQFQIQNRIRKAQRLMNDVESITEVALTTGFCDQSHFIKHFQKHVGLTPAVYKVSCRLLSHVDHSN